MQGLSFACIFIPYLLRNILFNFRSTKRNLYTNTVLVGSVCLFVRCRNHLPVVQFQNETHIRNPHGPAEVLRSFGALKVPQIFIFTAAEDGTPGALGGCFASTLR